MSLFTTGHFRGDMHGNDNDSVEEVFVRPAPVYDHEQHVSELTTQDAEDKKSDICTLSMSPTPSADLDMCTPTTSPITPSDFYICMPQLPPIPAVITSYPNFDLHRANINSEDDDFVHPAPRFDRTRLKADLRQRKLELKAKNEIPEEDMQDHPPPEIVQSNMMTKYRRIFVAPMNESEAGDTSEYDQANADDTEERDVIQVLTQNKPDDSMDMPEDEKKTSEEISCDGHVPSECSSDLNSEEGN